ncbi:MAG: MFS transporter, partial [Burkholderiales bacterium]
GPPRGAAADGRRPVGRGASDAGPDPGDDSDPLADDRRVVDADRVEGTVPGAGVRRTTSTGASDAGPDPRPHAADAPAWTPPARPLGIRTLIALSILNHVAFSGVRVSLTLSALHLHAPTFQVGMVLSFFSLLPMLLAIPGGRWIDRIGARGPMIVGTGIIVVGVLLPFVWLSMATLTATAILVGLGFLPFHLGIQKLVSELGTPDDRRHNLSLMAIGFSVSAFLGPTSAGFLIDGLGHRFAFGMLALLPVAAFAWLRRIRERLPDGRLAPPAASASMRIGDLLATPELRRLYIVVALISSAWDVHQFLVPLYGARIGLSASGIGLILGAFAVATMVVRMVVPLFLKDVSEWTAILYAMAVAGVVYALYPSFSSLEALLALSFVLGLGLGVSQPMTLSIMARSAPPGRLGEATGLRLMLVNGTQTVLPSAFGALGGLIGIGGLFWGMAVLLGGGLVGVGRAVSRRS